MSGEWDTIVRAFGAFSPRTIALWGSYGMGLNDRFTHDVDLIVYVDKLPFPSTKRKVFANLSDDSIEIVAFPFKADIFPHKHKFYEVTFKLCLEMEADVQKLLKGERSAEDTVAVFLHYTKPISDDGWMAKQKKIIKRYPDKLLESNLFMHLFLALRNIHYYERALKKRKQPFWAELCINEGLISLVHAVFASNRTYFGKDKWAEVQLRKLKYKPSGFDKKLIEVMHDRNFMAYKRLVFDVCRFCVSLHPKECADIIRIDSKLAGIDAIIESSNRKALE